MLPDLQRWLK